MNLAETEKLIYEKVWTEEEYRKKCHSLTLWHDHREIFPAHFDSALDLGCGRGLLFKHLNDFGIDTWAVDHTSNCLDENVGRIWGHKFSEVCLWDFDLKRSFELGICVDVMEHIPEEMVNWVLLQIADHCNMTVFKIANYPSSCLGHDLHPTLKPASWWQSKIEEIGGYVLPIKIELPKPNTYCFTWYT